MRIRTVSGDTLAAAMAKVREELGPDAIILHVEDAKSRKGVLVRAAAETPDAEAASLPAPGSIAAPHEFVETRLEHDLRARLRVFQPVRDTGERIDPHTLIVPALDFHRVPESVSARLARIASEASASASDAALAHALERTMGCAPLPQKPARPLVVLGAPGHGKTTALARLAAQAAATSHPIVLITLDTGKAGAVSQIETYGSLLKARVETCEDAGQLETAIKALSPACAIFVDTPGINPWDPAATSQARSWVTASGGEPVWIVSAEISADDSVETARLYRSLGARRMIATKLDTARRWGGVAAAAVQGPMALAGTISSAFLADGVEPPDQLTFARRIISAAKPHTDAWTPQTEARTA